MAIAPLPSDEPRQVPPELSWEQWYGQQARTVHQGMHILFSGPTQSGKTLLCRYVVRLRSFVVVFGTKPVDPSLDAYVDEGYTRIDHWPPTRHDLKEWSDEEARFILWPKIVTYEDLHRHRNVYRKCMADIFIEGRWAIVVDEGLWFSSKDGLDLGKELGAMAYGSASNKVSLHLLVQRPTQVPPVAWTSCSQALIFHSGRVEDVRQLASLGTYTPQDAAVAIQQLHGHQFLDLPCRGQAEWSVSEVVV